MGGDDAPHMVIAGAELARKEFKNIKFIFAGNETEIKSRLSQYPKLESIADIIHTDDVVPSDMTAGHALRQGRQSSMRLAINAVSEGRAHAVVSAGNTGALMAMAKFVLKTLPGITRPAIATVFPTQVEDKGSVVLDLGANIECSARNLVEFAILGSVYARSVTGVKRPKVALLNVGSEDVKGHGFIRKASEMLTENLKDAEYMGFVEGTDLNTGVADVIVADGFTGNVALKTIEGTAKLVSSMLKNSIKSSPLAYVGYLFMMPAFKKLKRRSDPRLYNGGMFLGLRGLCVKSHGGTDEVGFANAIKVAYHLAEYKFNDNVAEVINTMSLDDMFIEEEA